MSDDILWQIFADTGDPVSWLFYRANHIDKKNETPGAEDEPQALG